MSAIPSIIVRPAGTRGPVASLGIFNAWSEEAARYFVRRAAIAKLNKLDDHALHDIGLERSQIEAAVHGLMTPADRARM